MLFCYKKLLVEINENSEGNNAYAFFTTIVVVPKSLFYQRHSAFILKNKYMNMDIPKSRAFSFLNTDLCFGMAIVLKDFVIVSNIPF